MERVGVKQRGAPREDEGGLFSELLFGELRLHMESPKSRFPMYAPTFGPRVFPSQLCQLSLAQDIFWCPTIAQHVAHVLLVSSHRCWRDAAPIQLGRRDIFPHFGELAVVSARA